MVSGRCSGSSLSSGCSSSSTTSSPAARFAGGGRVDRMMVEEELEAAEALADLAHLAMRESCGRESAGGRVRKGKRVKSESPPRELLGLNLADSVTRCSDLAQDRIVSHQQYEKVCRNAEPLKAEHDHSKKNLKVRKDTKLPNTRPGTSKYSSLGCGKSRHNLTDAEKEARRIRRVLANRESARQTIRRRQALCEELTKKAADLASENGSLKREMEMALKEYQTLEITNKQLKDQMANVVKADAEEIPGSHKPACVQLTPPSALPANRPLFLYNHPPFTPLFWPPAPQSQNSVQVSHIPHNAIVMPSKIPFPAEARLDSCEQENLITTNGPRTPFYIFPCPWFFPQPDRMTTLQSQSSFFPKNEQEDTHLNDQYSATYSRINPNPEKQQSFLAVKVKTEPSGSFEARTADDLNKHQEEFAQDRDHQQRRGSKEPFVPLSPVEHMASTSTAKHENTPQLDSTPHFKTSPEVCYKKSPLPEKNCEPIIYSCKKSADAVAAAEARKRRKELTKLKNLHGRQCRMHC